MFLTPVRRCITTNLINSISCNYRINSRHIGNSAVFYWMRKKDEKSKKKEKDKMKIVTPGNCAENPVPLMDASCKVAIIVGGSMSYGYSAADQLLSKGARAVVIADSDSKRGEYVCKKLCNAYGNDRARFIRVDLNIENQFEGLFSDSVAIYKEIHIVVNNMDRIQNPGITNSCIRRSKKDSCIDERTTIFTQLGVKYVGKHNKGPGGIVINCASILGFMGWPKNPAPIYCCKESVIETTKVIAAQHDVGQTGMRVVSLCPINRPLRAIGLPSDPNEFVIPKRNCAAVPCSVESHIGVGTAVLHLIQWAQTGSTWVIEPPPMLYEKPREIFFPKTENEEIDPEIYSQPYNSTTTPVKIDWKISTKSYGSMCKKLPPPKIDKSACLKQQQKLNKLKQQTIPMNQQVTQKPKQQSQK